MNEWLDIAARVKAEWGIPLFVAVSYTFTCLFAISQVRAARLDRSYTRKRELTRLQVRALAFLVGAPMQLLVGYLWGLPGEQAAVHAVAAGLAAPVVADLWIAVLRWRGCHESADVFKVARNRRAEDGDNTGEMTRL